MAIAPLYIYNIAMTIVAIGGIVGIISIIAHHYITKH
jgi:hypothetical protein